MTQDQFTDRVDGITNDFIDGITNEKQFKTAICDLLISVAKPHLSTQTIPMFGTIARMNDFRLALEMITDVDGLNELRNAVLNYHRNNYDHPLKDEKYGFSTVFKALDNRAYELKFIKVSSGYRKPST